ncbi:MAG: hypothetical protein LIO75_07930 [Lachnospiraceae bacterium]|nr:hypothetical protein [Lachnospiraceae bacterium]
MTTLNIAGITVGADNRYPLSQWNCEEHITADSLLFVVSAVEKEIREEYGTLRASAALRIVKAAFSIARQVVSSMGWSS